MHAFWSLYRWPVVRILVVYLDDIIIYSPELSSHMQHLDEVFKRLWRRGLKLWLDKCKVLQCEVKFLGHVVNQNGVNPAPEKISAVVGLACSDWLAIIDVLCLDLLKLQTL